MQTAPPTIGNQEFIVSAREWDQYCRLYQSMCWYTQPQQAVFGYNANALMPFVHHSASYPQQGVLLGADVKTEPNFVKLE